MGPELVEYAIAAAACEGERDCGDRYLVMPTSKGILVVVVDGLGHGAPAAAVARQAIDAVKRNAEQPMSPMVKLCHEAIQNTRGVVLSVASFDAAANTMTFLCVGNIEGALFRRNQLPEYEPLLTRAGVVGFQLPPLQPTVMSIAPGDTLIFATDGIRPDFLGDLKLTSSLQHIADSICAGYRKATDDALVLVARYYGDGARPEEEGG